MISDLRATKRPLVNVIQKWFWLLVGFEKALIAHGTQLECLNTFVNVESLMDRHQ